MAFNRLEVNDLATAALDDSDQIIVGESNTYKKATVSALKNNILGTSPTYTTDTEPYLMRKTAHTGVVGKCALNKLIGGSLGWNQLIYGDFADTTHWGGTRATIAVSGGVMTGTCNSTGFVTLNSNLPTSVQNHKVAILFDFKSSLSSIYLRGSVSNSSVNVNSFLGKTYTGATSWASVSAVYMPTQDGASQLRIGADMTAGDTLSLRNVMFIDLTTMFGSTIADYVYGLESATAGSGIAWLSRYIDLSTYHAYDAGSIQSVQTTAHVTTGFNQFDEVVEAGYWDATTGQKASGGNWMRCANYIPVLPNTEYKIHFTSGSGSQGSLVYLDGNKSVILYVSSYISAVITTPSNCRYMVFYANSGWFGGNICINISKTTGSPKNGDYVPYSGHTYPLGSDTLRGIPQLVGNKLAFHGDEKTPDGTIKRKYGIANIDDLTFTYDSTNKWLMGSSALPNSISSTTAMPNSMTDMPYDAVAANTLNVNTKAWTLYTGKVVVKDSSLTEAQLRAAISGKHIVYPLATPTTESSTSYQKVQTIDADGTESFTTSSPVPVGHETQTADNILAALSWVGE